jgi:hypothetical protein
MTTKNRPTGFSLPHAHFIEHLVGVIENPPRKHDKKLGKLKPWIRRLKNKTDFHLQEPSTNQENHNLQLTKRIKSSGKQQSPNENEYRNAKNKILKREPRLLGGTVKLGTGIYEKPSGQFLGLIIMSH